MVNNLNLNHIPGRVAVLPGHLAQKIAAGEVIERPQSVIRELLDNALDAGARQIQVWLRGGGVAELVVQDDGCGMNQSDLALCWQPHATSKIHSEADLYRITTLGFRGEALSAIAAVSHLTIQSCDQEIGREIQIHGGEVWPIVPVACSRGTRVQVQDLFFNLPARREFLKRAASESGLCQTTLIEKALCFPNVAFRLDVDGEPKLQLPALSADGAYLARVLQIYQREIQFPEFLQEISGTTPQAKIRVVLARPELFRNDRRQIQIFVNQRRIHDFGLQQAVEYGFSGFLPGGRFPIGFLFLTVEPERVDVNIHPAKREVRLRDYAAIHHRIVELIQSFLRAQAIRPIATAERSGQPNNSQSGLFADRLPTPSYNDAVTESATRYGASGLSSPTKTIAPTFTYLGQALDVFLLCEYQQSLILIDFHAAHERWLFNQLLQDTVAQALLVPRIITTEVVAEQWLLREAETGLLSQGVKIQPIASGEWQLLAAPAWLHQHEKTLETFLQAPHGAASEILRQAAAQIACRAALKDGHRFDRDEAIQLIQKTLSLPEPFCPHGRPVWYELERTELLSLIGRHIPATA